MRIAIDLLFDGEQTTGAGLYGYRLAAHLARLYPRDTVIVCLRRDNAAKLGPRPPNLRCLYAPIPPRRWARRLWEQLILPLQLLWCRADLLHAVDNTGLLVAPCPQVLSVLDLLFLRYPRLRFEPRKRLWYRLMVPLSLRRARRVITLSEATARDLRRLLCLRPDRPRLTVIPAGIDAPPALPAAEATALRYPIVGDAPYILAVGTQEPIKDHATLLRAHALLRRHLAQPPLLVIAGREERATADLRALAAALDLTGTVILAGYVPPATLSALYTGAALLAFPSLDEGFGLPPLEALAHGTPVVATTAGPLPAILGDAALFVPPGDAAALAEACRRVLEDTELRASLRARGQAVVTGYTWETCAHLTRAVYRAVLQGEPRRPTRPARATPPPSPGVSQRSSAPAP